MTDLAVGAEVVVVPRWLQLLLFVRSGKTLGCYPVYASYSGLARGEQACLSSGLLWADFRKYRPVLAMGCFTLGWAVERFGPVLVRAIGLRPNRYRMHSAQLSLGQSFLEFRSFSGPLLFSGS